MTLQLVSISLQTYNRAGSGYLRVALDAILAQTYSDFELLVIDNHSADETAGLVLSYKDSRLTYVRLPPGGTPADSIRAAFRMSRGIYLLTTHDDDIMEPDMLEKQMACVSNHPELLCLATNVSLIDGSGAILQPRLYEMKSDRFFAPGEYIRTYFEEKLWFPTPTLLFRRDAVVSRRRAFVQECAAAYFPSGDIAGLFRLNTSGGVGILAAPLLRHRQHLLQESRNVDQSAPLVALSVFATRLLSRYRGHDRLNALMPSVRGFSARFHAQDELFKSDEVTFSKPISKLKADWESRVKIQDRAVDAVLPFEILLEEAGLGGTIPLNALDRLLQTPARTASQAAYRNWLAILKKGGCIFNGITTGGRIAIFGSMLTAYILVLAARRCGIEVTCCVDSSPARIGKNVLGVPVISLASFADCDGESEMLVTSSEREQEESLFKILSPLVGERVSAISSWKEMVSL